MELYNSPKERRQLARHLAESVFEDNTLVKDIVAMLSDEGRTILRDAVVREGLIGEVLGSDMRECTLAEILTKLGAV